MWFFGYNINTNNIHFSCTDNFYVHWNDELWSVIKKRILLIFFSSNTFFLIQITNEQDDYITFHNF